MKLWKKGIAIVLFAVIILVMTPQSINACTKNPNCYSTSVDAVCSDVKTVFGGEHQIGVPNGTVVTCRITVVYGTHQLYCKGCAAYLGTDTRTCSMIHSNSKYCTSRYNLCQ